MSIKNRIGSDWPQLWQFLDFSTSGWAKMYWNLILKSSILIPFAANLLRFVSNSYIVDLTPQHLVSERLLPSTPWWEFSPRRTRTKGRPWVSPWPTRAISPSKTTSWWSTVTLTLRPHLQPRWRSLLQTTGFLSNLYVLSLSFWICLQLVKSSMIKISLFCIFNFLFLKKLTFKESFNVPLMYF